MNEVSRTSKELTAFRDDPDVIDAIAARCRSTAVVVVVEMADSMGAAAREIRRLQARVRELEGASNEPREEPYDDMVYRKVTEMAATLPGLSKDECGRLIERAMDRFHGRTSQPPKVQHAVTCKLFPDPHDERDPVGPCTCGATPPKEGVASDGCTIVQ